VCANRSLTVFVIVVFAAPFAVFARAADSSETRVHIGYFYLGLEELSVYPCGSVESWWVEKHPKELEDSYQHITGISDQLTVFPEPIYVEFIGTISDVGEYGYGGIYSREVEIERVLKVHRVYTDGRHCKPAGDLPIGGVILEVPLDES